MHLGRIEFIIVLITDWSFASGCPPPASRRRSCLPLRTNQCFCPIGTFTLLLARRLLLATSGHRLEMSNLKIRSEGPYNRG